MIIIEKVTMMKTMIKVSSYQLSVSCVGRSYQFHHKRRLAPRTRSRSAGPRLIWLPPNHIQRPRSFKHPMSQVSKSRVTSFKIQVSVFKFSAGFPIDLPIFNHHHRSTVSKLHQFLPTSGQWRPPAAGLVAELFSRFSKWLQCGSQI